MASRLHGSAKGFARFCARAALFLCLFAVAFSGAIEQAAAVHVDAPHAIGAVADSLDEAGPSGGDLAGAVDHDCHGCSHQALAAPGRIARPAVIGAARIWASLPSAQGRAPLIDLPPPRA